MYEYDLDAIKMALTPEQIVLLAQSMGVTHYEDRSNCLVFPTICHNIDPDEASMKLYYYKNTHLFRCYTECADTFSIYDLFKRYYELHHISYNFIEDIVCKILFVAKLSTAQLTVQSGYIPQRHKFVPPETNELVVYDSGVLEVFLPIPPVEWLNEGISIESMKKYNIRFSISQNKIVIPHYNIDGQLIGIRGRALNEWEINNFGKYMPIKVESKFYSHPLSLNLYGLNMTKDNIRNSKTCILFEGEKSVLLCDTHFPNNMSAAVCGSGLNKHQLEILVKQCGVQNIVLAFDKEFQTPTSEEAKTYFDKLVTLSKKYQAYCNFSFIFDSKGLLGYKDSPIDKGPDIFKELLEKRIEV